MRFFFIVLGLMVASNSVAAAGECESVIALSKIVSTTVADRESVEQHAANFCSEYSRSKDTASSSSFKASYKFLSASFGGSNITAEAVASKYCSASNNLAGSRDAYRHYIETISPNAYNAYEQCLKMTKEDLIFNVNVASIRPKDFSMSASYVGSTQESKKADVMYSAPKGVTCHWGETSAKMCTIKSGTTAILECERMDQTERSYVTLVRTDSGKREPMTLPWPAYNEDGVPIDTVRGMQIRIDALNSEINSLQKADNSLNSRTTALEGLHSFGGFYSVDDCNTNSVKNPLTGQYSCPQGYTAKKVGRVKGSEPPMCGVTQYLCIGK